MEPTQAMVVGVNAGFCVLSLAAASTRLHRTVSKTRSLQMHDVLLVCALVCGITEAVIQCVATRYGLGLGGQVEPRGLAGPNVEVFFKLYLSFFVSYFACNMFVKLSLLAFYRKLAPDNRYDWILWLMAVVAILFGLGSILATCLSCVPINKFWDTSAPGTCINIQAFYYANGAFMIFNDILLYILPIVIVRGVQLSKSRRAAMNLLFGLGFVVVITSGLRMVAIHNLFSVPLYSLYYQAVLLIWCTVENHLALIIICLPAVRAALVAVAPSLASHPTSLWSKIIGRRPPAYAGRASPAARALHSSETMLTSHGGGGGAGAGAGARKSKSWFTTTTEHGGSSSHHSRISIVSAQTTPQRSVVDGAMEKLLCVSGRGSGGGGFGGFGGGFGGHGSARHMASAAARCGDDEIELRKDVSVQVMEEGGGGGGGGGGGSRARAGSEDAGSVSTSRSWEGRPAAAAAIFHHEVSRCVLMGEARK